MLNSVLPTIGPIGTADVYTVVVAGSFGRLEAGAESDLDFMILTEHKLAQEVEERVILTVRQSAEELGIKLPNPEGVFSQATDYVQLAADTGSKADTLDHLAQRMLILMEARPIFNESVYNNATNFILDKYLQNIRDEPVKEAVFLLNDLIRYFRSICVNLEFNWWRQNEHWAVRNAKLRHSRVIMYAGLLLTVANSSIQKDKISYIRKMLSFTPIERITQIYMEANDHGYQRILSLYDLFLMRIQCPETRIELQSFEYEERHKSSKYREMSVTGSALGAELARFVFAQRGRWSEKMFEHLLF